MLGVAVNEEYEADEEITYWKNLGKGLSPDDRRLETLVELLRSDPDPEFVACMKELGWHDAEA